MKVLISAFSCGAGLGSEPGVGWNYALMMSPHHDVTVLTTSEFSDRNDAALAGMKSPSFRIKYYDLPFGLAHLRRSGLGMQIYYYLWQVLGTRAAARLHAAEQFDLAHHVTFVRVWSPSLLRNLNIPFIWGPVGGAERTPKGFSVDFDFTDRIKEYIKELILKASYWDPFLRRTLKACSWALATTRQSSEFLRRRGFSRVSIAGESGLSTGELSTLGDNPHPPSRIIRFVCIGRLIHWKGFQLAVRGFALAGVENSELWICGEGPFRRTLQSLVARSNIQSKVVFWGELPREECLDKLKESHVLVHPSLHDSGGWVCLEAMAARRPIICLNHGGPEYQVSHECGVKVPPVDYRAAVERIAAAMRLLAADSQRRNTMGRLGRARVKRSFLWERKADEYLRLYQRTMQSNADETREEGS